ncbi:hypothetical protein [Streptomyces sp. NPDC003697]
MAGWNSTVPGDSVRKIVPCRQRTGNNTGAEPAKNGAGADGTNCKYARSDVTYR